MEFDWSYGPHPVLGIDEVGTGAVAGPIVIAGVWLKTKAAAEALLIAGVNDSKAVAPTKRERIYGTVLEMPSQDITWMTYCIESWDIDTMGHHGAIGHGVTRIIKTFLAHCGTDDHTVLLDGNELKGITAKHVSIVKGDQKSISIAAASIMAKVTRDSAMVAWGARYPEYGFEDHKGYVTGQHRMALEAHGPCDIHRRHTEPVKAAALLYASTRSDGQSCAPSGVVPRE